jgi:hypothetical protein
MPRYALAVAAALFVVSAGLLAALLAARSSAGERLRQAESRLAEERNKSESLQNQIAAMSQTQSSAEVFSLVRTRSAETVPVNTVVIPASPQWIVLSLELPSGIHPQSYRVRLHDAGGRILSELSELTPATSDALAFGLHSSVLSEGNYLIELEGRAPSGLTSLGNFSFRAVR